MRNGEVTRTKKAKRHPLDWYVEQGWEWDMVARQIGMEPELADGAAIWDPAAGYGHAGSRLADWGFSTRIYLSDLVENVAWQDFHIRPTFFSADFLELTAPPVRPVSIFMNAPYSYIEGIGEAFVRHALKLATHRVVTLFPIKWLAGGKKRGRLFRLDHPPQQVLYFTQRPSMPPGDMIDAMGSKAYKDGAVDYCAVVWDVRHPTAPGETRSVWLPRFDDPIGEAL
ncbi:class I SAM-dependent methyltransferase [Aurantiacibacter xanthus]|uniref:Class I SAM-dependent methyltransferase n=1 Tax=Aurantiacibacter xanthus TaxID=1784712 RepID=A0A3A1P5Z7_9SPHN|nr:class I SAM-dependent methyltransferase [Aurantiacibacter xanthus]RIV82982.1 class I SAM-dependent methyltransferase [Aurantiacibacter xanthus]